MDKFGTKLHALREQRGLTVRQLATMLGIKSHTHIVGLETGKHKPSVDFVLKVANFFDVSTDKLMKDELEISS